jgi:hypothetical protein
MSENTNPMDEVVGRVLGKVAPDGRAWLPCDLDGTPIPEVSDDLFRLIAAVRAETLREVRKVTQGLRDALGKEGDYPLPIRAYELRDMLADIDALEEK